MTPSREVARALVAVQPPSLRKALGATLRKQCGGDWTRVRANPDGSFTVGRPGLAGHALPRTPPDAARAAPEPPAGRVPAPVPQSTPRAAAPTPGAAGTASATPPRVEAMETLPRASPAPAPEAFVLRGRCAHIGADGTRCAERVPEPGDRCVSHDGRLRLLRGGPRPQPLAEQRKPLPSPNVGPGQAPAREPKKKRKKGSVPFRVKPEALRQLYEHAVALGCDLSRTSSNHVKIRTPSGKVVIGSTTGSDHRSIRNTRAHLRQGGVAV